MDKFESEHLSVRTAPLVDEPNFLSLQVPTEAGNVNIHILPPNLSYLDYASAVYIYLPDGSFKEYGFKEGEWEEVK